MKPLIFLLSVLAVLGANVSLHLDGRGVLVKSGLTDDRWSRRCVYYRPVQLIETTQPLSQACDTLTDLKRSRLP